MPLLATPSDAGFADQLAALRPLLVRLARRRLRNDAWAEDAVSETLMAALEKPAGFGGRASTQAWLVGILRHKVVDQIRHHTRECQLDSGLDGDEADLAEVAERAGSGGPGFGFWASTPWGDPQQHLTQQQLMAQLDRCLQALPAQQGRAFLLRNGLEEDTEVICEELGVNANHLGVMLHRARQRLRESLQPLWQPATA